MPSSVRDTVLDKTTLIASNQRVKDASIFPFFEQSGQVRQLMVLLPDFNNVFMLPFKKGLASVTFLGAVRLSTDMAELMSYSDFTSKQVDHLYHYDPNWRLSHERFSDYWAKNLIKQSNCADHIGERVRNLLFSKDLSLLERIRIKVGYLITPQKLFGEFFPAQSERIDLFSEPSKGGWQLNPIWNHWCSNRT